MDKNLIESSNNDGFDLTGTNFTKRAWNLFLEQTCKLFSVFLVPDKENVCEGSTSFERVKGYEAVREI